MTSLIPACVCFENGYCVEALSFGASKESIGEAVFNTSMTGYQEIASDPSYAGQFVVFTMPEIGIVGCNDNDKESRNIFARGILVNRYSPSVSNFRATQSLADFLRAHDAMGICGLDTRKIVQMLRVEGAMAMIASTKNFDKESLLATLRTAPKIGEQNLVAQCSTKAPYTHDEANFDFGTQSYPKKPTTRKIVAIDFGIKRAILNNLVEAGFAVEVIPHSFSAESLIARFNAHEIDAVFLSNGPGDPRFLGAEIEQIKRLIAANVPIFGICLGHQLLSIAQGFPTYKLKFGHHGGNHPVKNLRTGAVEITSQNHIYSVPDSIEQIADVTHRNLFDGTIEGLRYKDHLIFSVQHHPEASPGPTESTPLFAEFARLLCR